MELINRSVYCDDNLIILKQLPDNCIDMIYLDPPYNTGRTQKTRAVEKYGSYEYSDSWDDPDLWNEKEVELKFCNYSLHQFIHAVENLHSEKMRTYLLMLAFRLIELKRIIKSDSTIYIHCDDKASHYIKVCMDYIFGQSNFKNEIIWKRCFMQYSVTRNIPRNTDVILRYAMGNYTFNLETLRVPYNQENLDKTAAAQYYHQDEDERIYKLDTLLNQFQEPESSRHYELMGVTRTWRWTKTRMQQEIDNGLVIQTNPGRVPRYKRYLDEQKGRLTGVIWDDIQHLGPQDNERCGYPTQKPASLLIRLINLATNQGDWVLDPFCGSGTTCIASEKLNRNWIGIDRHPQVQEIVDKRIANEIGDLLL